MSGYLPFLLVLGLWIYAFVDCLNTPEDQVRNLPKVVWALVVLLFGAVVVGSAAWMLAGRPRPDGTGSDAVRPVRRERPPAPVRWVAPDDNPEFLRSLGEANRARREGEGDEMPPAV